MSGISKLHTSHREHAVTKAISIERPANTPGVNSILGALAVIAGLLFTWITLCAV
jgi:hypothetical protein